MSKPIIYLENSLYKDLKTKKKLMPHEAENEIKKILLNSDTIRANLPPLDATILLDSTRGHWDLYWNENNIPSNSYKKLEVNSTYKARNPLHDVKTEASVAIDFGTTSTVVALREHGKSRLLRVGIENFKSLPRTQDYENPTALKFENFDELEKSWYSTEFRPLVKWSTIKCSHQAKSELFSSEYSALRTGFKELKTWARLKPENSEITLIDAQKKEKTLSFYDKNNYPNPLELYAFFLGIHINNQLHNDGQIFNEYYLTFPVKFDRNTKQRILTAFKNGLKKSLPPSFAYQVHIPAAEETPIQKEMKQKEKKGFFSSLFSKKEKSIEKLDINTSPVYKSLPLSIQDNIEETGEFPFIVEEIANEPIAYAAAALSVMDIKPTKDGVIFGVFDFGGGTTDFAIGLYRLASEEENNHEGWVHVLEILDSAGDENLGGEHILSHLVSYIVKENKERLLSNSIQFKNSIEPEIFSGSEYLFNDSAIARSNAERLAEIIRPLWENSELITNQTGQLQVSLEDKSGSRVNVNLNIDEEVLNTLIKERIYKGIKAFFTTFQQAIHYSNFKTEMFHILLAGNSCQSPFVLELFEQVKEELFTKEKLIEIHEEHKHEEGKSEEDKEYEKALEAMNSYLLEPVENKENLLHKENKEEIPENILDEGMLDEDITEEIIIKEREKDDLYDLIKIHPPLLANNEHLEGITLKTGVALGLLLTLPGEPLGVINKFSTTAQGNADQEENREGAPFEYTVGLFEKDILVPTITRYTGYYQWQALTKVYNSKVTRFGYTNSVLALENKSKAEECRHKKIKWNESDIGKTVFICATAPNEIAIALSSDPDDFIQYGQSIKYIL